ncbi:hypothetical protein E4U43_007401 [Claviceps pusilla]|uniref:Uncharacterized protein n=1 Tax=Claviceps pusilla TaxID=123648 RepID=A0A9P7T3T3_9HYPO|nr:hypothetical protein E4U43_007401 [Claviceps pusilla]
MTPCSGTKCVQTCALLQDGRARGQRESISSIFSLVEYGVENPTFLLGLFPRTAAESRPRQAQAHRDDGRDGEMPRGDLNWAMSCPQQHAAGKVGR